MVLEEDLARANSDLSLQKTEVICLIHSSLFQFSFPSFHFPFRYLTLPHVVSVLNN